MKQKNSFSGQIGFVFAAAGSAVGVGNLWRFPYLAAKDGGGLFLIIYLVLVLTVGFVLLTTDIAIGRKTGKSAIYAYESMSKKMEISWSDHIPGSGIDHDLLRGDWWMDLKIYRDLSYKFRKAGSSR